MDTGSSDEDLSALFPEDAFDTTSAPHTASPAGSNGPSGKGLLSIPSSRGDRRRSVDMLVAKVKMAQMEGALQAQSNRGGSGLQGSLSSDSLDSGDFEYVKAAEGSTSQLGLLGSNSVKLSIRMYWIRSRWYIVADAFNAFCSLAVVTIYFRMTYSNSVLYLYTTLVLCVFFMLELFITLIFADSWVDSLFKFNSMLDLVIVIPILVQVYMLQIGHDLTDSTPMKLISVCRSLRLLRLNDLLKYLSSEIERRIGKLGILLLTAVAAIGGLIQVIENYYREHQWIELLSFTDAVYFVVTTLTTVGFGDILPLSPASKVIMVIVILGEVYFIPKTVSSLVDVMSMRSIYASKSYQAETKHGDHVLICGEFDFTGVRDFLLEFFHPDHGATSTTAVILNNGLPSRDLVALMQDPNLPVVYLQGSPLYSRDLSRASAETAKQCFVLTNKFSSNPSAVDTRTILRAVAIHQYTSVLAKKKVPIGMQVMYEESKNAFRLTRSSLENQVFRTVCIGTMKMNLLAKSCHCPGAIAMVRNLITSDASETKMALKSQPMWFTEYTQGSEYEIYITKLSDVFTGATFCEVATAVFLELGVVLFALDIRPFTASSRIVLNPGKFVIPNATFGTIYAFVIAKAKAEADLLSMSSRESKVSAYAKAPLTKKLRQIQETLKKFKKARLDQEQGSVGPSSRPKSVFFPGNDESEPGLDLGRKRKTSIFLDPDEQKQEESETRNPGHGPATSLEDATITTSVAEELPQLENFIVLTGSVRSLYQFIRPLRSRNVGSIQPIIILHDREIEFTYWNRISRFEEIFFIKGSRLESADLVRAGILQAKTAIILAPNAATDVHSEESSTLLDADTIFTYQGIKKLNPKINVVAEFISASNTDYVTDQVAASAAKGQDDTERNPSLELQASGSIYNASLLDTLLSQTFYNPRINTILRELITDCDREAGDNWNKHLKGKIPPVEDSVMYQIPVPVSYFGKTYGELFEHLCLEENVVSLGLFRGLSPGDDIGPQDNFVPYVYTNPSKQTTLCSTDHVYILSTTPPKKFLEERARDLKRAYSVLQSRSSLKLTDDDDETVGTSVKSLNNTIEVIEDMFREYKSIVTKQAEQLRSQQVELETLDAERSARAKLEQDNLKLKHEIRDLKRIT